jgi:hypothetical protein
MRDTPHLRNQLDRSAGCKGRRGVVGLLAEYRREVVTAAYVQLLGLLVGSLCRSSTSRSVMPAVGAMWLLVRMPHLFKAVCWLLGMPIRD